MYTFPSSYLSFLRQSFLTKNLLRNDWLFGFSLYPPPPPPLYGNHDNHSTIKCFFDNYWKNETKKHPIPNASWDYDFQSQNSKFCELINLSLLISKTNLLWRWACQILGRDKWKNRDKTGNAQFPRALKGDFYHLSLNVTTPSISLFWFKISLLT